MGVLSVILAGGPSRPLEVPHWPAVKGRGADELGYPVYGLPLTAVPLPGKGPPAPRTGDGA
eukprot:12869655-Prorocentrum_lima.AAC.1